MWFFGPAGSGSNGFGSLTDAHRKLNQGEDLLIIVSNGSQEFLYLGTHTDVIGASSCNYPARIALPCTCRTGAGRAVRPFPGTQRGVGGDAVTPPAPNTLESPGPKDRGFFCHLGVERVGYQAKGWEP